MVIVIALQVVLWVWFLGAVVTYRFGKVLLVEGMGVKSAEFGALCLYSAGVGAFYVIPSAGRWILFGILLLWAAVQFSCHWYYTIFGVSEQKLMGYNGCFAETVHIVPASDKRLVPDLYHIVLHALILANLVVCVV